MVIEVFNQKDELSKIYNNVYVIDFDDTNQFGIYDNDSHKLLINLPFEKFYYVETDSKKDQKINSLFKAKILAYSKDMFTSAVASYMKKFMDDFNIDTDMMLVQYKDIDRVDLDGFLDCFRRIDCQYVFNGDFYYREELEKIVSPYCKEMCISVVPKMSKNNRDFIYPKNDYGYLTISTITPTISICDEAK